MSHLDLDIFRRFLVLKTMLKDICSPKEKATLLDLGGYPGTFAQEFGDQFPNLKIITADRIKCEAENFVHLVSDERPFGNDEFDYVICSDVLEHVPIDKRDFFLQEISRITKDQCIICFPYQNPLSEQIEIQLAHAWKELRGTDHPWLKEHIEYGLPNLKSVVDQLAQYGAITLYGSAEFEDWLKYQWYSLLKSAFDDFVEPTDNYSKMFMEKIRKNLTAETNYPDKKSTLKNYYRIFIQLNKNKKPDTLPKTDWVVSENDGVFMECICQSLMFKEIASVLDTKSPKSDLAGEINARLEAALLEAEKKSRDTKPSFFNFLTRGMK